MSEFIEIARFHHAEPLELCLMRLTEAAIPHRVSDDSPTLNEGFLLVSSLPSSIVLVPRSRFAESKTVLLTAAREEVAQDAQSDPASPLHKYDISELQTVLREPQDWSEYDLALAEHLLREKGASIPEIHFEAPPYAPPDTRSPIGPARPGRRRVRTLLIAVGILFAISEPLYGIITGLSLLLSFETDATGTRRFYFDTVARVSGAVIILFIMLFWVWGLGSSLINP